MRITFVLENDMNLRDSLNRLYYNMTIYDIRYVNRSITGNLSYNSIMYLDIIAYQDNCTVSSIAELWEFQNRGYKEGK